MQSLTATVLVAAALALATAAAAATPPTSAVKAALPTPASPQAAKRAACEKTWKAQTKHTGKHKAFVAACVAKG
jgi:hypothetical protein